MRKGVVIGLVVASAAAVVTGIAVAVMKRSNDGLMCPDEDDYEEDVFYDEDLDEEDKPKEDEEA